MVSIFKKELNSFFSSLVGYMAIIVFLLVCGFFMWVVPNNNMLDYGYATMDKFFVFAPWVLMFLLPALTMRSFSDEYKGGTIEILSTIPLTENQIILGKFFASFVLVLFSILPTLLYVYTISHLSIIQGNLDSGGILGSYIGLLFLSAAFTAIGIFCSSVTSNQVIAFLIAIFTNFILYAGFETMSKMPFLGNGIDYIVSQIGMQFHYNSISRGLLDSRDIVYFLSIVAIFILATRLSLQKRKWN
ncbi:MAG TPA: gliding motility-associated ABC transporter permease subunit GldF [Chitinophagaceae bacterium]|nr:gliding motility-associated ABC transporter permease subunit GldF [Chitinophagaceae bacterium]